MSALIPDYEKHNGQQWVSAKPRCYMCRSFNSNMPLTGRCLTPETSGKAGLIVSHDFMPADGCIGAFNPKYPDFHKTTEEPI